MNLSLLEHVLGNTLLALPLAVIAWRLGRTGRHPSITHLVWVLVLLRLVLPPLPAASWLSVNVPVTASMVAPLTAQIRPAELIQPLAALSVAHAKPAAAGGVPPARPGVSAVSSAADGSANPTASSSGTPARSALRSGDWIGLLWLTGTALVVAVSGWRLYRFQRLVDTTGAPASSRIRGLAERAAADLGLPMRARILTVPAKIPPLVWGLFGRPSVVLPHVITDALSDDEMTLVLMHEFAHLQRRDHLVRWLDWAVVAWLWWNPIAWLARLGLRGNEELACDALVLRYDRAKPRRYGHCLVTVYEALHRPAIRTPVQTCTLGDGGSLEQRIRFIMSNTLGQRPSGVLRGFIIAAAFISLVVGVTFGHAVSANTADSETAASRTLTASIDGATRLAVTTLNGTIRVVRDESLSAMTISASIDTTRRNGRSRSEHQQLIDSARLIANKDAAGQAKVELDFPGSSDNLPSVSLAIKTPALASVEAEVVNGNVTVEGDLGRIRAETVNGNVDVSGARSTVAAESVNGEVSIVLAADASDSVTAEATNGHVALDLPPPGAWNGTIEASATVGSITASGLSRATLDKRWTGEDFNATVGRGQPAKAQLNVTNGSIRIRQP